MDDNHYRIMFLILDSILLTRGMYLTKRAICRLLRRKVVERFGLREMCLAIDSLVEHGCLSTDFIDDIRVYYKSDSAMNALD